MTLSTTKFKYMVNVVIVVEESLDNLSIQQVCVKVRCDSESTIHLTNNHIHHAHTKYIDRKISFCTIYCKCGS